MSDWISVNDRLPDEKVTVLVWVKNKDPKGRFNPEGVYIGKWESKEVEHDPKGERNFFGLPGYDSQWNISGWSYYSEPEVTHWMPLPDPPKEATT